MRKILTIFLSLILMFSLAGEAICTEPGSEGSALIIEEDAGFEEGAAEPAYDMGTDYMRLMIKCAVRGDMGALSKAVESRNQKISGLGLEYEPMTAEAFIDNFEAYAGFELGQDYLTQMSDCCLSGDVESGTDAANKRNLKIRAGEYGEAEIDFMDLFLLSKIIYAESGSYWLSDDWKMCVGEVVLNRVASPEFPNTIREVLAQPGQYYGPNSRYFNNLLPSERCVKCAIRLLEGERLMEPSVVFQANFTQGSGVHTKMYDKLLGNTYFCHSSHMDLY